MSTPKLKRSLSLTLLTLYGLGNILGAGIYVLVGKVAGEAGIHAPLSFLIAMVVAGLTAFSYMELSSRFPQSAGSSLYVHKAFGVKAMSLGVGLSMVLGGITSAAALSHGFAGYLNTLISVPPLLASCSLLIFLGIVAAKGINDSAKLASIFTLVEIAGLLLIIGFGASKLGSISPSEVLAVHPSIGLSGVLFGTFLAFYAFIGFEDMVNVAEEVRNPQRIMPIAILLSLISATVLYMLVILVSVAAVAPAELAGSSAPLSLVIDRVSSLSPKTISIIGLAAALNGVIVQIIMGSRMLYGMSKQGWVLPKLSAIDPISKTPVLATVVVVVLMLFSTLLLPLVSLAQLTSFLVLIIFTLVNVSLIVIKRKHPQPVSVRRVPLLVPLLGALSSAGITGYQLLSLV